MGAEVTPESAGEITDQIIGDIREHLTGLLRVSYNDEGVMRWLTNARREFDYKTPLEMIDDVRELLLQAEGAVGQIAT